MNPRPYGHKTVAGKPRGLYQFRGTAKWKRTRLKVLNRDGWICHWCGGQANEADHVQPVSQGGAKFDLVNLVASCGPCNRARPVVGVNDYAGGVHSKGVRFSAGSPSLYEARGNLSPPIPASRTATVARVRNSHQSGRFRANADDDPQDPNSQLSGDYSAAMQEYADGPRD